MLIENPRKKLFDTYNAPSSRIIFKVETDNVDDCNLYDEEYLYTENLWPGGPRQLLNPVFWIEVCRFDYLPTKPPRGLSINIRAKIKVFNSVYLFSLIFLYYQLGRALDLSATALSYLYLADNLINFFCWNLKNHET